MATDKQKAKQRQSERVLAMLEQLHNMRRELIADGCSARVTSIALPQAVEYLEALRYAIDTDS